jgi:hypothetical protein
VLSLYHLQILRVPSRRAMRVDPMVARGPQIRIAPLAGIERQRGCNANCVTELWQPQSTLTTQIPVSNSASSHPSGFRAVGQPYRSPVWSLPGTPVKPKTWLETVTLPELGEWRISPPELLDEFIAIMHQMTPTDPAYPLCRMSTHAASMGGFASAGAAGKVKWNVAPWPPSPMVQIRPPCDSTIDLLIARPMPLP